MTSRRLTPAQQAIEAERCRRSAHHFLFSPWLVTKDEHDLDRPVKPFPELPYLRAMLDLLLVSGRLLPPEGAHHAQAAGVDLTFLIGLAQAGVCFIEKSRQMLVSWLLSAYALWRARSRAHQLVLIQSKKEDDAANLVYTKEADKARISFMESHLPPWLRVLTFPGSAAYGRLYFPNGSQIWGIPEGSHIIRSNTASLIISDEAAFQPEFGDAYTAALPAVKGGGQLVAVSSAHPGAFCELVEGETYDDEAAA